MTLSDSSLDPLTRAALDALHQAAQIPIYEETRQVRTPDTWLLRRCWQALASSGSAGATLSAVSLIEEVEPLSLFRALPRLAARATEDPEIHSAVGEQLRRLHGSIQRPRIGERVVWAEQILSIACSAALIGRPVYAFSALERLDQEPVIWRTVFASQECRALLATTVSQIGLHPLTSMLLRDAIRRHEDSGAYFVEAVARQAASRLDASREDDDEVEPNRRLLQRCVETCRHSTLLSLLSRRSAAVIFALDGEVEEVLEQIQTIANVQEARRESGIFSARDSEQMLVRQVRRPRANADVDFRFYAFKEATDALPLDRLSPVQKGFVADRLSEMGGQSDGWTAAAATSALLRLGAVDQAVHLVDRIDAQDPARSEAYRTLVEGLLRLEDEERAAEATRKAVRWAHSLPEIHPERLTVWGLAQAYLEHGNADQALKILEMRRTPGLVTRLRRLFGEETGDEHVREEALRLRASLLGSRKEEEKARKHLDSIRESAPTVLGGKALAHFYREYLLLPLLETDGTDLLWEVLQDVAEALGRISGRELPTRVEDIAQVLAKRLESERSDEGAIVDQAGSQAAARMLGSLWAHNAEKSIWQTVYSLGGSLPLVISLVGSDAVLKIAEYAAVEGQSWRPIVVEEPEADPVGFASWR